MAWGRPADLPPVITNGVKTEAEGGNGAAKKLLAYCDQEVKNYL